MNDRYNTKEYRKARKEALARSNNICQFCGFEEANHGHHWAMEYPPIGTETPDDITGLCSSCHELATLIRRCFKYGININQVLKKIEEEVSKCGTESELKAYLQSSCIAVGEDLTIDHKSVLTSQKLPRKEEQTERKPMI